MNKTSTIHQIYPDLGKRKIANRQTAKSAATRIKSGSTLVITFG